MVLNKTLEKKYESEEKEREFYNCYELIIRHISNEKEKNSFIFKIKNAFRHCKRHNIIKERERQVEVREEQWSAYHKTYQCHLSIINILVQLKLDIKRQLQILFAIQDF